MPDPSRSNDILRMLCVSIHWIQSGGGIHDQVHLVNIKGMAIAALLSQLKERFRIQETNENIKLTDKENCIKFTTIRGYKKVVIQTNPNYVVKN